MPKKDDLQDQLEEIQQHLKSLDNQLKDIKEILKLESETVRMEEELVQTIEIRRSLGLFYFGVFLGVLNGILGNYFVSLTFQPPTQATFAGLTVSGLGLLTVSFVLWRRIQKYLR